MIMTLYNTRVCRLIRGWGGGDGYCFQVIVEVTRNVTYSPETHCPLDELHVSSGGEGGRSAADTILATGSGCRFKLIDDLCASGSEFRALL